MNYEPLYTFAEKHRVPYNELCTALRAALAAPQPEPVALCDALRWSGAKESHGAMMFSPNQLRKFYEFASRAAPPAAPAPADMVTVPREPTQEMIAAGEAVFRSYCFRHVNGAIPTYEAMIAAVPAPAAREPQDERIRWRDAVIKEAESALRTAEQEFADMPTWANVGHAAKKVTHALAVIAALGIGGGGK